MRLDGPIGLRGRLRTGGRDWRPRQALDDNDKVLRPVSNATHATDAVRSKPSWLPSERGQRFRRLPLPGREVLPSLEKTLRRHGQSDAGHPWPKSYMRVLGSYRLPKSSGAPAHRQDSQIVWLSDGRFRRQTQSLSDAGPRGLSSPDPRAVRHRDWPPARRPDEAGDAGRSSW